jgi:hypothetical protein
MLPLVCNHPREWGIVMPTQIMLDGEYITPSKIRIRGGGDAAPTRCADQCGGQCSPTRRVFFRALMGKIAATLTAIKALGDRLYGAQEAGAAEAAERLAAEHRRVALIDSATIQTLTAGGFGSQGPVRAEEFSIVGVFDVDWLLEPRFQRLLDNVTASPVAFRAVRFFGSLNSGTREDIDPTDGGIVWPSVASPMDLSYGQKTHAASRL